MIVKKYANRRLYDMDSSRYVTLEELAERIRAGADVKVLDAKTNEDLTQPTLAQIILESRGASKLLPSGLLVQLIRMNDESLAEFLGRYLSWALDMYMSARQGAQALAPYNPLAMAPFNATSAIARLLGGVAGWRDGSPRPAASPAPESAPASTDMADLRRELDELKKEMKKRRH
ncbi:MAG: polyhydroxyalkanoate synthesis regulator DNA-binding domain-containing protein [Polyangiaceae bacterium]|jgi:polyhydroxyalkanoate synthesis repressor PhaR